MILELYVTSKCLNLYGGSSNKYYLSYDQVGSLRLVTDAAGNVVKRVDYDSFGYVVSDTNPSMTMPFGFAGGLYDGDTGIIRFGARDYDPDTGRWTAKDPILFNGGDTDLYGYCVNDPVNLVDTSGLCPGDKKKCIDKFLRENYGNFMAKTVIPEFSAISLATNFTDFVKGSAISLSAKGALVGLPWLAGKIATTTGNNLAAYPGMAGASADAQETGAFWETTSATLGEAAAVAITAVTAFSTTADALARWNCRGME